MKVKEVTVGLTDSIKVSNYSYLKPELRLVIELDPDIPVTEQIEKAEAYLLDRMKRYKRKIVESRDS